MYGVTRDSDRALSSFLFFFFLFVFSGSTMTSFVCIPAGVLCWVDLAHGGLGTLQG
jgi:hypothetical protein